MHKAEFPPGAALMRQGAQADSLMVICSGALEISTSDETGARHVITRIGRGQVIGEMALLTDEPRSADVVALTRVRALVLPSETFHQLAEEYPALAIVLSRLISTRLGQAERDVLAGKTFGGYRIGNRLGRGGMAIVYDGIHLESARRVALKMMSHRLVYDRAALAQFQREADIVEGFDHPNIVATFGRFAAFHTFFIAMAYCEGRTLSQMIKELGAQPRSFVERTIAQLAAALDYAHGKGVIHRDVKPANVMLGSDGRVSLMDFGLARPLEDDDPTLKSLIVGTPPFMSPEQLAGRSLSPLSDYWSLGCIAYELLTGERLFRPKNVADMRRLHRQWRGLPAGSMPKSAGARLKAFLLTSLQVEPGKRRVDLRQVADWVKSE
jgi:serine/threonine-protein kinase